MMMDKCDLMNVCMYVIKYEKINKKEWHPATKTFVYGADTIAETKLLISPFLR
jgi:hypothetical protein